MENKQIEDLLVKMGIAEPISEIQRFRNEEDNEYYNVWKIEAGPTMVLKEAKAKEIDTYHAFFTTESTWAPRLLATAREGERDYLLMEFVSGSSLRRCDRKILVKVLDSLIDMQKAWWGYPAPAKGYHYKESLTGRRNRRNYLMDAQLEVAYDAFLAQYEKTPQTLCHDDLLPFNVICSEERAVFIDWEYGGILPYPTSLARLLAHGEEQENAFFYMTDADKAFAVDYYYYQLIRHMDVPYEEYIAAFRLFLFYEYCEWVYVGNKFADTSTPRFRSYFAKAKQLAAELGY